MHPSYPPHLNSNHPHLQIQQEHDQASHTATSHISHSLHQQPQAQHIRPLEHQETYHGFVKEKQDAILLVEACIANQLHAITPHELSVGMASLPMRNGTIIVFVESSAQVAKMRWRDAGLWSSSRISGPFLLYREIESSNQKKPNIPQSEQGGLFSTSSLRPYTRLVEGGLAKRTVTIVGSDGNRYRVINYFYPAEVEGFFRKGGRTAGLSLKVPSEVAEFDQYKPLLGGSVQISKAGSSRSSTLSLGSREEGESSAISPVRLEALPVAVDSGPSYNTSATSSIHNSYYYASQGSSSVVWDATGQASEYSQPSVFSTLHPVFHLPQGLVPSSQPTHPRWTEEPVILPPLRNLGVALPPLRSILQEDETSEYIKRHIREKEEQ